MANRALEIVLTLLFAMVLGGIFLLLVGQNALEAPQLLITGFWVGLLGWAALLIISAYRAQSRGRERRRWNNVACAAGAAVLNFLVLSIMGMAIGGYSALLVIVSAAAGAVFIAAAALSTLLVHRFPAQRNPPADTPAQP
jgi:membrane protein implicated in regulation of membrane protease activity